MPKSNFRYKHMDGKGENYSGVDAFQSSLTRSDLLLSTPPRKVSFEDNRNDSGVSIHGDDYIPTNNNKVMEAGEITASSQERRSIRRKRSLLVRPVTSLSLVDLARSEAQDGTSLVICEKSSGDEIEGRNSKRVCSFNLSPRSVVDASDLCDASRDTSSSELFSAEGESKSIRTSPWGHFIDMAPPEEEHYFDLPRKPYANYNYTVNTTRRGVLHRSCKDSPCRSRRRPSPYCGYKSHEIGAEHSTLSFVGLRTDIKSTTRKFRLSPRKNYRLQCSAEELVGVFSELQVRQVLDQKTIPKAVNQNWE